ncbi:MAG: zinc ribbon domain-containing protein [Actinomycetota bacterium]
MRRCPLCGEEVQDRALKCRHCGSVLPSAAGAPGGPEGVEVIRTGRRYLVASRGNIVGVWDRFSAAEPVATFDTSDEGSDAALEQFGKMERLSSRSLSRWFPTLGWFFIVALLVWVAVSGLSEYLEVRAFTGLTRERSEIQMLATVNAIQAIAFAVWVGSLAITAFLWVRSRAEKD